MNDKNLLCSFPDSWDEILCESSVEWDFSIQTEKILNSNGITWDFLYEKIWLLNTSKSLEKAFHETWFTCNFSKQDEIFEFYGIKDETFQETYLAEIEKIQKEPNLQKLYNMIHFILFQSENLYEEIWSWKTDASKASFFAIVCLLNGYETHLKSNLSPEQLEIHKKAIHTLCFDDMERYNLGGIRWSQVVWGCYFMRGRIFQIWVLQYEIDKEHVNIHIPRGTFLGEWELQQSFAQAREFFWEKDFLLKTWLLSNELDSLLWKNSNIIKFKQKFEIVDQVQNTKDFLKFVFWELNDTWKYEILAEETSL